MIRLSSKILSLGSGWVGIHLNDVHVVLRTSGVRCTEYGAQKFLPFSSAELSPTTI